MSALDLVRAIELAGGSLQVNGDRLRYSIPRDVAHLIPALREAKRDILLILRKRGRFTCGRCGTCFDTHVGLAAHQGSRCVERIPRRTIATMQRCPNCFSYALYRERDGSLTCDTCKVRR